MPDWFVHLAFFTRLRWTGLLYWKYGLAAADVTFLILITLTFIVLRVCWNIPALCVYVWTVAVCLGWLQHSVLRLRWGVICSSPLKPCFCTSLWLPIRYTDWIRRTFILDIKTHGTRGRIHTHTYRAFDSGIQLLFVQLYIITLTDVLPAFSVMALRTV